MPPFHLAFAVHSLEATRRFYADLLGAREGRSAERWVDFDFFGHQISAHLVDDDVHVEPTNVVDGNDVPVRHFGVILPWSDWESLAERLRNAGVQFLIGPRVRFRGEVGEQATMFFRDPSGNALEIKAFRNPSEIFRR